MKCDKLQQVENPIEWGLYYDKSEVDDAIAELKSENERLNRELEHVKNGDCINTCDVVEKHVKEELKAKRALYKACVNWMTNRQCAMRCYDLEARAKKFDKAIAKCRAKAEECK